MLSRKTLVALAAVVPALAVPASASASALIGSGSSAEQPVLQALFSAYHKVQPHLEFVYSADGGNAGAHDVQQGRSQFSINTRPPQASDAGLTYIEIYKDGLCVDVNPANHLTNIGTSQLANIFLGNLTSWTSLPGSGLSSTIAPFGRASSSGSYTFFQQAILNGQLQASNVAAESTDGEVATAIKNNSAGIGYVGLAHSGKHSGVKRVAINGVACTPSKIKSGAYLLSRYIWLVVPTSHPSKTALSFASWIRTKNAAKVINQAGAVAVFAHKNGK